MYPLGIHFWLAAYEGDLAAIEHTSATLGDGRFRGTMVGLREGFVAYLSPFVVDSHRCWRWFAETVGVDRNAESRQKRIEEIDTALRKRDNERLGIVYHPETAYLERGAGAVVDQDWKIAVADLSQAIRLDPTMIPAHELRGIAFLCTNDFEKAIEDFDKMIRLAPTPDIAARGFNLRADVFRKTADFREAERAGVEARRLAQKDPAALDGRGRTWGSEAVGKPDWVQRDYDRVRATLQEAQRLVHAGEDVTAGADR